ncbi:hypothetical protein FSPOR_4038 [Fusarium sporotrichioides]|uniref:Uncharacterized protein n=1 Tax=Fusarium sporotrichioides TaxID=5514 RepID=A0A395SDM4_FUSSP|nr:hypothetical protein FSPOR_4038 [Fusarium sporotrichioides]
MSAPATIQEPNRLSTLPPEIFFKILKETTQKEECWINILTKDFPVFYKGTTEVLPSTDAMYSGSSAVRPFGPSSGVRNKQLFPPDDMLECQRLKHVMIRSSPWEGRFDNLVDRVLREANPFRDSNQTSLMQTYLHMILCERKIEQHISLLSIDWSLLSGLESLCFDLHTTSWRKSHKQLKPLLLNMS